MTLAKCFESSNVSNPKCIAKLSTSCSLSVLERRLNSHPYAANKTKETIFMAVEEKVFLPQYPCLLVIAAGNKWCKKCGKQGRGGKGSHTGQWNVTPAGTVILICWLWHLTSFLIYSLLKSKHSEESLPKDISTQSGNHAELHPEHNPQIFT